MNEKLVKDVTEMVNKSLRKRVPTHYLVPEYITKEFLRAILEKWTGIKDEDAP